MKELKTLTVLKPFKLQGRNLQPGETVLMSARDARIYVAIGKCTEAQASEVTPVVAVPVAPPAEAPAPPAQAPAPVGDADAPAPAPEAAPAEAAPAPAPAPAAEAPAAPTRARASRARVSTQS